MLRGGGGGIIQFHIICADPVNSSQDASTFSVNYPGTFKKILIKIHKDTVLFKVTGGYISLIFSAGGNYHSAGGNYHLICGRRALLDLVQVRSIRSSPGFWTKDVGLLVQGPNTFIANTLSPSGLLCTSIGAYVFFVGTWTLRAGFKVRIRAACLGPTFMFPEHGQVKSPAGCYPSLSLRLIKLHRRGSMSDKLQNVSNQYRHINIKTKQQ